MKFLAPPRSSAARDVCARCSPTHHAKPSATNPPRAARAAPKKASQGRPAKDFFHPTEVRSTGTVTVGGQPIAYDAIAGTLVVHAKDWEDTDAVEADADADKSDKDKTGPKPEASMFYTAYFKQGAPAAGRPITFLFNGGPGSSSIWLHMGAFGPVRVVDRRCTATPRQRPTAIVNNDESLLDASDLVFIDAPGTGFSRIAGKDKEKAFYGVDQDIHAFTDFITPVPDQVRPLELAQICVRRELRDDARGRPVARAAEGGRRPQRRDAAVGHPQLGLHARRSAAQPGHRHALRRRAADLCGDCLVFQQGAEPAGRSARLPRPGRAVRDGRLRAGAAEGQRLPDAERQRIAEQLSAYTGLAGALSPEVQPADRIWRVPEGAARRSGA